MERRGVGVDALITSEQLIESPLEKQLHPV